MDNSLKSEKCFANEYSEELFEWIKDSVSRLNSDLRIETDNCPTHLNTKIEVLYPDKHSREKYSSQVESIFEDALGLYQI